MKHSLAILGLLAVVQTCAAAPDPSDPKAAVAQLDYKSAFEGYRGQSDAKVESWRAMNDNVGRIGGWRVYLKEAQQPDPPTAAPAAQSKPAAPANPVAPRGQHTH